MNIAPAPLSWAAISALLVPTASRDLSGIDGAFGLSAAEWTVVCFAGGVLCMAVGAVAALWRSNA